MFMKILIVSSQYPPRPSPEGAHMLFLCEKLATGGEKVGLLTSNLLPGFPLPQGFRLYPLMKSWGWRQFPALLLNIRRLQPDVVLLNYLDWIYGCHPMITFLPAALRWVVPGMICVTQFGNVSGLTGALTPNGRKTRIVKRLVSWLVGRHGLHPVYGSLLRDSTRIIALSERHLEVFERDHPGVSNKSVVIPCPPILRFAAEMKPGSNRTRGRAMLGLSDEDLVLAYFGYVYWMKGVETLLTAFASLPDCARLVIIGGSEDTGYLEKLQELSRSTGGSERVIWVGHCKPEEESASLYLSAADICVLPFNDGVRLNNSSFAVAASHGLPIVTTRGEVLEAPFIDGENVRLCPPKDSAALVTAITELIHSPETRNRLSAGASKLAEDHFSWDRVTDSMLCVLRGADANE